MTTRWTLTIDCTSPAVVAAFWKEALGYVDALPPAGFASWEAWFVASGVPEDEWDDGAALVDPLGVAPPLSLLRVREEKSVKNRLHLDLQVSGGRAQPAGSRREAIRATVARLVRAGGAVVAEHHVDDALDHVVMSDPEGNEFCVV